MGHATLTSYRRPRRARSDLAGPYQKEAAIRAAENAIRPWSAYAGLGERRGAQFADLAAGSRMAEGLGYGRDAQAPSRFTLPDPAYAAAVSRTAQQVRSTSQRLKGLKAWVAEADVHRRVGACGRLGSRACCLCAVRPRSMSGGVKHPCPPLLGAPPMMRCCSCALTPLRRPLLRWRGRAQMGTAFCPYSGSQPLKHGPC